MADPYLLPTFIPGPRLQDGTDLTKLGTSLGISTVILPIPAMAGLANAQVRKVAIPFPFKVTKVGFRVGTPTTGAGATATLTAQINGTAVTGGVTTPTLAGTTTSGTLVAGTAITGANTASASGGTLEVAVSAVTAFTAGDGYVEFTVQHL